MRWDTITATVKFNESVTEENKRQLAAILIADILDKSDSIFEETKRMNIYRDVIGILTAMTAVSSAIWAGIENGFKLPVLLYPLTILMYVIAAFWFTNYLMFKTGKHIMIVSTAGFFILLVLATVLNPFSISGIASLIAGTFLPTIDSNLLLETDRLLDYTIVYSYICDSIKNDDITDKGINKIFNIEKTKVHVKGIFEQNK